MANKCEMCGLCCKLFLINLNEQEFYSGQYKTIFNDFDSVLIFAEVKKYGLNLLAQKEDGSCIYLENNSCSIHEWRPKVCRGFFCSSKDKRYQNMKKMVKSKQKVVL
ncbi:hypothetical protein AUK11_00115 [bacterium CG2_30_37_16]|nr:MAG: hypothetical protein AUK11_00115 [bacterium CG2_30_37_16]PIP30576.1 MAG: hypothetical protein COX25_03990 [bacterium (Candidatus Howlettbacteria) CG23_combo_of_CG06-09_8_20_14_all_37_9]PIX99663.1 MAG: hypothetical protein COZ22_02015 [bacterium (Candidatus Howlettbacteria) CG_4_10_14_3_um_filter_37_10]PJB06485.1 MAG: hypothetical protein CO123_02070 [bacterium (Candidatus Howlettbacteria) CG_4_9_14_3_um_filter_37_10]